ncbi:MAG: hypothetical protein O3A00_11670, partial [Planctomycetota bacterium]|nr:hypothetical protein [Planctomycetota bacterium]
MKNVDLNEATAEAREWVQQAAAEPILLRDDEGRTFLLAELNDADAEAMALEENPQLPEIIQRSRTRAEREGSSVSGCRTGTPLLPVTGRRAG